jgi:hypothetical protein
MKSQGPAKDVICTAIFDVVFVLVIVAARIIESLSVVAVDLDCDLAYQ